ANFTEAANNWNLEKLYVDLAVAKGRGLTPVEKKFLRGLLCGYSPAEIAAQVYKSGSSSAVRVYLSNGLYKYIQDLLLQQGGSGMAIKNWSRITNLLEKAGYKLPYGQQVTLADNASESPQPSTEVSRVIDKYQEWQGGISVEIFYGRQKELTQLKQWIVEDGCRLVAILGMGGIGKTALATQLAEQAAPQFESLIWRSLRSAPPLEDLLEDLVQSLGEQKRISLPLTVEGKISWLMAYLRSHQCLLVLDQVEAILRPHQFAGGYREGYEGYGQLFARLGEERHKSCCLVTSREKPKDIAILAGTKLPVRTFQLGGLNTEEAIKLFHIKCQSALEAEQESIVRLYGNNPLLIKIAATTIQDIFDGDATEFLAEGTIVFGDICELLDQQFNRLSSTEKQVMYGLAIKPRLEMLPIGLEALVPAMSKWQRLEALESLQRRSLIERKSTNFTQSPLLKIYVTQKLTDQMVQEMSAKEVALLVGRTLMNSLLNDNQSHQAATNQNGSLTSLVETNDDVVSKT
ncbi:MAG: NB-ARC domain-containing protein, partial [Microcoleus sp. SIO2G3]|nr:NB-ARC domain-containing protein [Microcoleus sp. SIO2G3]